MTECKLLKVEDDSVTLIGGDNKELSVETEKNCYYHREPAGHMRGLFWAGLFRN